MKNKNFAKASVVVLLATMLVTFTHCLSNAPVSGTGTAAKRSPSSSPSDVVDAPAPTPSQPEQVLNLAQVEVGMRNHEQLLYTFSELTGVSTMNSNIQSVYTQVEGSLPTNNDVKTFLAPNQVAIARLGAEFCSLLIDNASIGGVMTRRQEIWPAFGFDTITLANFNQSLQMMFAQNMIHAFWGEDVLSPEEEDMAIDELLNLMNNLAMGESTNNAGMKKVIKGACTSALSSAYVTMM
jgi:hypothetical protein